MNPDAALPTRRLDAGVALAQARPWATDPVTLDSPALAVMTDLTQVKAATVGPQATLRQAEQAMIVLGVRMLFVASELPAVEGLLTSTDLDGDRAMAAVQQRRIRHDELVAADVMTPLAALDAIEFAALRGATVRNLVATLKAHGRNHLLVVDGPPPRVRGVVSRSQIERQLGQPVEVVPVANSFAELGRMLG